MNHLLIRELIDAKDNLSIQVHPSDEYALKMKIALVKQRCGIFYLLIQDVEYMLDLRMMKIFC